MRRVVLMANLRMWGCVHWMSLINGHLSPVFLKTVIVVDRITVSIIKGTIEVVDVGLVRRRLGSSSREGIS